MSILLNEALLGLSLKPGERRVIAVEDQDFEVRRIEISDEDAAPMMYLDFSPPPADRTYLVEVQPTPMEYPRPFEITESDLAPA